MGLPMSSFKTHPDFNQVFIRTKSLILFGPSLLTLQKWRGERFMEMNVLLNHAHKKWMGENVYISSPPPQKRQKGNQHLKLSLSNY